MKVSVALCLVLALAFTSAVMAQVPRKLGQFAVTNPSFMLVSPFSGTSNNLIITSFTGNPFAGGNIYKVENIASFLSNVSAIEPVSICTSLSWPNTVTYVDPSVLHVQGLLLVADGFLIPGKDTGSISLVPINGGQPVTISTSKSGYFYHKAVWVDMNGDGKLDILTARATKGLFSSGSGELLWLEQPASSPLTSAWTEHVLQQGPDVMFTVAELDNNATTIEVVATQFFTNQVSLTIIATGTTPSVVLYRTIDNTIGAAYSVSLEDLDADGKKELLVTNHMGSSSQSAMYAYEIPADVTSGNFTRHTLATGFVTVSSQYAAASPGFPYAFQPKTSGTGRPYIALAGDGSNESYLFTPTSTQFGYSQAILDNVGGTVGALAVADVDGDGYTEIFVPNYDKNYVDVWTFSP